MAEPEKKPEDPKWSLVVWGGFAIVVFLFGLWCVWDGWFREWEKADLNKWMAVGSFIGVAWCLWRGRKEYRMLKHRAVESSSSGPAEGREAEGRKATAEQGEAAPGQQMPGKPSSDESPAEPASPDQPSAPDS